MIKLRGTGVNGDGYTGTGEGVSGKVICVNDLCPVRLKSVKFHCD